MPEYHRFLSWHTHPNKLMGVLALFGSIAVLVFVPWLDTSKVRSATYRPIYRQFFWIFVITCVGLTWLGSQPPEGGYVVASRILTIYYFLHFLVVMPVVGLVERPKPLPASINDPVLPPGEPVRQAAE
jgi:ubiquinol-cytochrome c reductase cytochrome b subunit